MVGGCSPASATKSRSSSGGDVGALVGVLDGINGRLPGGGFLLGGMSKLVACVFSLRRPRSAQRALQGVEDVEAAFPHMHEGPASEAPVVIDRGHPQRARGGDLLL